MDAAKNGPRMKIAFLWTALSGYMNACLKELSARDGVELFVSYQLPGEEAPYEDSQFAWLANKIAWRNSVNVAELQKRLSEFKPDIMVIPSWHVNGYRAVAKGFARRTWRVMVMDNPWRASLKQRLGALLAPLYVRPIADVAWLPGERQATFAKKLGFSERTILRGSLTCDQPAFSAVHDGRLAQNLPLPRSFIFIGRMVPAKSVDILAESYKAYRHRCSNPWPLICCGAGPMRSRLENQEGVRVAGFIQPEEMPRVLGSVGCLILPSTFEPWALVIHEAASAGRIILACENVGAVTHLVQPGYNGFIFNDKDVGGLTALMSRVSSMNDVQLNQMSCASHQLSGQFSPRQWADILLQSYQSRALAT
jgi:glycosyltransferase involved in cell wall biosynthesis